MQTPSASPEIGGAWPTLIRLQLGQAAGLATGVASIILVSRWLGPEQYGLLTLLTALAQYVVILSVNWTTSSVVRFGREEVIVHGGAQRVFGTRLLIALAGFAIAAVVVYAGWSYWPVANTLPPGSLGLALTLSLTLAVADHMDGTLQGTGAWRGYAWLGAIEKSAFLTLVGLAAMIGTHPSVRAAAIAAIVAQVLRIGIGGWHVARGGLALPPRIDAVTARAILHYSWPQFLTFTVGYFSAFVEPFLISRWLDLASVGVYNVAYQASLMFAAVLIPIGSMLLPALTSLRSQQREDLVVVLLQRLVPQAVFLLAMVISGGMVIAGIALPWVFGDSYAGAVAPLVILLTAVSYQAITTMYGPVAAAYDMTREVAALNVVGGLAIHLAPQLVLIPLLGINGAAISWAIWYVGSALVLVTLAERRLHTRLRVVLLYPLIAPASAAVVLAAGPTAGPAFVVVLIAAAFFLALRQGLFAQPDEALLKSVGVPAAVRRPLAAFARIGNGSTWPRRRYD